ncbi:MAG: hypothetical protein JNM91_04465 [Flavobacteriales bacterium]|nr:hypothetical protein [Flavobacteriales bacterium]
MKALMLAIAFVSATAVEALSVTISKYQDSPCGQPLWQLSANAQGGVGPYTYLWSNGATTPELQFLLPGTYTVTVTDGASDQAQATEEILLLPSHPYPVGGPSVAFCEPGGEYAVVHFDETGVTHGPGPYQILSHAAVALPGQNDWFTFYYIFTPGAAPGSAETITWADASGCQGTAEVAVSYDFQPPALVSLTSSGACAGNNGRVDAVFDATGNYLAGVHLFRANGSLVDPAENFINMAGPFQTQWTGLAAGAYWVVVDPDALNSYSPAAYGLPACADSFYVEVPDLTGTCGFVQGKVFFDHDQDCTPDLDEAGIPDRLITFLPGPEYAYTNQNGNYTRRMTNGTYSVEVSGTGTELYPLCPSTQAVDVTVNGNIVAQDFADSSLIDLDVRANIAGGAARPGFVQNLWVKASNLSGQLSGAVDMVLTIDPQFSFLSAEVPPTSVAGNTITWSGLAPLSGFDFHRIPVYVQVPADINLLGQPFSHTLSVAQSGTDANLANNSAVASDVVIGSYDPNDKTAFTSTRTSASQYFIDEDQWIDYRIRFQNTGTDTAFNVVVRDTLSQDLDMGTFEMGISSHDATITFLPHRVVEWRFANILLPDSNVNEAASHGQIEFRIRPAQPLVPGTSIRNAASIYFDYNPPVITEPSVLVAEFSTGIAEMEQRVLRLVPNPVNDAVTVLVPQATPVRLFGMDGRAIDVPMTRTGNGILLDVRALGSGTYLVQTADGRALLVKQ